jgi:hypothetical protein
MTVQASSIDFPGNQEQGCWNCYEKFKADPYWKGKFHELSHFWEQVSKEAFILHVVFETLESIEEREKDGRR